jgi:hypothetical protein
VSDAAWTAFADLLDPPKNIYLKDPVGWVEDELGEFIWSKQALLMEATTKYRKTVVKAAHSVGKTRALSRLVAHWVKVHPIGESLVVITSDSDDQIKGGIWRELVALHTKAGLPGKITLDGKWHAGPNNQTLVAFARKPSDRNPTGLQGYHAKYLLVLIDECAGVPFELWDACESLASNEGGVVLAVGNPTDPMSHFAVVCRPDSTWHVQQISAFDTPAFTGERVPQDLLENLATPVWVEERKKVYGEDTALYSARVLGEFPEDASDSVVPVSWAYRCKKLDLPCNPDRITSIGVDVGAGIDETVIVPFTDRTFGEQRCSRNADPMDAVGKIVNAIRDYRNPVVRAHNDGISVICNIDAIGVGWGVAGRVTEVCEENGWGDVQVNAVKVSELDREPAKYKNIRSALWWRAREACHDELWDLGALDDKCINELTTPKWSENSSGQIEVEKRELIVKRLGHSPDRASAMILAPFRPPRLEAQQVRMSDSRMRGRR